MAELFSGRVRLEIEIDVWVKEADAVEVAAAGDSYIFEDEEESFERAHLATPEELQPDIDRQNRLLRALMSDPHTRIEWVMNTAYTEAEQAVSELMSWDVGIAEDKEVMRVVDSLSPEDREYFHAADESRWFAEATSDIADASSARVVGMVVKGLPWGDVHIPVKGAY